MSAARAASFHKQKSIAAVAVVVAAVVVAVAVLVLAVAANLAQFASTVAATMAPKIRPS